jgi:hypothetical protein
VAIRVTDDFPFRRWEPFDHVLKHAIKELSWVEPTGVPGKHYMRDMCCIKDGVGNPLRNWDPAPSISITAEYCNSLEALIKSTL